VRADRDACEAAPGSATDSSPKRFSRRHRRRAALAAALYAHLTERTFYQVEQLDELPPDCNLAVVVLTTERIDYALMDRFAACRLAAGALCRAS
jgi:hypothetical protein